MPVMQEMVRNVITMDWYQRDSGYPSSIKQLYFSWPNGAAGQLQITTMPTGGAGRQFCYQEFNSYGLYEGRFVIESKAPGTIILQMEFLNLITI
jgi:hypothetical protein